MNKRDTTAGTIGVLDTLVTVRKPQSSAAEAYRTLWANLRFGGTGHNERVVLFTSAQSDEGKTTTLLNVGVVAAQSGSSVILVDADLRRPTAHAALSPADAPGFTSALLGDANVAEAVRDTGIERLRLLSRGPLPANPAEVLRTAS